MKKPQRSKESTEHLEEPGVNGSSKRRRETPVNLREDCSMDQHKSSSNEQEIDIFFTDQQKRSLSERDIVNSGRQYEGESEYDQRNVSAEDDNDDSSSKHQLKGPIQSEGNDYVRKLSLFYRNQHQKIL